MSVSSEASLAGNTSPLFRAARSVALQDVVQFAYLTALLLAVYAGTGPTRSGALWWLTFDLVVFGAGVVAYRGGARRRRALRSSRTGSRPACR